MPRFIVWLIISVGLISATSTALAQETGSGGVIVQGSGTNSIGPLNSLRCSGTACQSVTRWLTVDFIGIDPTTYAYAPNVAGALVKDWTISADGLTYTFNLNDNLRWSDGEVVDGWDYLFTYYAYKHADEFDSTYSYLVDDIETVKVSADGYTVTITFSTTVCDVLGDAIRPIVPSHVFGWDPAVGEDFDWSALIEHPYEYEPQVSGGPFMFHSRDIERIVLVANPNYYKPVIPEGLIYVFDLDQSAIADRFVAGELNVLDNAPQSKFAEIRAANHVQSYTVPGNSWVYLSLNFADPANPMMGVEVDADENPVLDAAGLPIPVEQPPHPMFHDVRVRRAIQLALNVDTLIDKVVFGEAIAMPSYVSPDSPAFNPDLVPFKQDQATALALLAEVGWVDSDGDGILDKDGVPFEFELVTVGNRSLVELIQQQLAEIGVVVHFRFVDFLQLLDIMDSQTFDAVCFSWGTSPLDPDATNIFSSGADILGSGFNSMSYSNPEVDRLFQAARNMPGCKPEDRIPLYYEIQRILQEDQAYIWLYANYNLYAVDKSVTNWNPLPGNMFYQVEDWSIVN